MKEEIGEEIGSRTRTNARYIDACFIQNRHHMAPFRYRAFQARVECVSGEYGDEIWPSFIGCGCISIILGAVLQTWRRFEVSIMVDDGLKTSETTDRFCRSGSEKNQESRQKGLL